MATMAITITIDLDEGDLAVLDAAIDAMAVNHGIATSRAELVMIAVIMIREGLHRPGSWEGEYIAATLDLERDALARLRPREDFAPSVSSESSAPRGPVAGITPGEIAPDELGAREDPAQIASARTAHRASVIRRAESGARAMSTFAEAFPSLHVAPGVRPWNPQVLEA